MTTVLLLGGGKLLAAFLEYLQSQAGLHTIVLSSKRHLDADVDDRGSLRQIVAAMSVPHVDLSTLQPAALTSLGVDLANAGWLSPA